ncbi:MAG: Asp-tRNA(Asn)/Glu-tRNA(Gln) amidotransferase subunit GatB, partial [Chloroflexota bacterium]
LATHCLAIMKTIQYEPIIGIEVHAEIGTRSKMFCGCRVVDTTNAAPNSAVCPVCAAMPGMLPVVNQKAVTYGIRAALALGCEIAPVSIFARKNYFYPDLPKGYQISQYDQPLARRGKLSIVSEHGERTIRVRRVHLEEDTGKLTHINHETLVDLNRAGVPLLEIVSEPDLRSAKEARAYGESLRNILRYLGVNSGNMQKGVLRFEANISVRPVGGKTLGTRTEVKNLNSFRALERSILYETRRQGELLQQGGIVKQQTMGWDEKREVTIPQRSKEGEDDYRYFPEPDLPPLRIESSWIEEIQAAMPELPNAKSIRFQEQYGLQAKEAAFLTAEGDTADYYETVLASAPDISPKLAFHWLTGELSGLMNQARAAFPDIKVTPQALGELLNLLEAGEINQAAGKVVLAEIFQNGGSAKTIVAKRDLHQVSNPSEISAWVAAVLAENPTELASYKSGKEGVANWFFGQVMQLAKGKANPQAIRLELEKQLKN